MSRNVVTAEQVMQDLNSLGATANRIKAERDAALAINLELLEALELLYGDAREFHDQDGVGASGSHTNCGWCRAEAAIAKAKEGVHA